MARIFSIVLPASSSPNSPHRFPRLWADSRRTALKTRKVPRIRATPLCLPPQARATTTASPIPWRARRRRPAPMINFPTPSGATVLHEALMASFPMRWRARKSPRGTVTSAQAQQDPGSYFSDAVASSQVGAGARDNNSSPLAISQTSPAEKNWWSTPAPTPEALAAADEIARADPFYFDTAKNAAFSEGIKQAPQFIDDVVRATSNEITFGQADRLAAYLEAKIGIGGVYGDYEANLRAEQYRTEHVNPTAAAIGSLGGLLVGGGAANELGHAGLKLGRKLLPYAGRFIPQLGRLTTTAEEAGTLARDAKLAGNAAEGASEVAGGSAATNSGEAISTEAATTGEAPAAAEPTDPIETNSTTDAAEDAVGDGNEEANSAANENRDPRAAWNELSRDEKRQIFGRLTEILGSAKSAVYEFEGTSGLKYVGSSGQVRARILRHLRRGKLSPDKIDTIRINPVDGDRTAREIEEHLTVQKYGGILDKDGTQILENERWPIGKGRQHLLSSPSPGTGLSY